LPVNRSITAEICCPEYSGAQKNILQPHRRQQWVIPPKANMLRRAFSFPQQRLKPAMIAPVIRVMTQANHQILSKWLKRATSYMRAGNCRVP
jgi:hypothetical protein